jgi:hypothetical protein
VVCLSGAPGPKTPWTPGRQPDSATAPTCNASITTGRRPNEGFPNVITLHALVSPPNDPDRKGTDVILCGAKDADVEAAKQFFLRYSG